MRKVLIYFQDDRAHRHQQKGRPPCGHPRTTRTIRKGQRGHLPRARRGSRGQSRSYVVARAQVRLAFSHLALPLPLFLSFLVCLCVDSPHPLPPTPYRSHSPRTKTYTAKPPHHPLSLSKARATDPPRTSCLSCDILHHASRVHPARLIRTRVKLKGRQVRKILKGSPGRNGSTPDLDETFALKLLPNVEHTFSFGAHVGSSLKKGKCRG